LRLDDLIGISASHVWTKYISAERQMIKQPNGAKEKHTVK